MRPSFPAWPLFMTLCCIACAHTPQQVPTYQPKIIKRYVHDTQAFTQGLTYLGNDQILESTGLVGKSELRLTELQTGKILKQQTIPLAKAFGEGSTQLNGTIYYLTWQSNTVFAFNLQTWQETARFQYPTEGWGLTHNGQELILSDGSSKLTWHHPQTFAPIRQLNITFKDKPLNYLNELEYIQNHIYANIWMTNKIARIHPQSGKVTAWIDLSQLNAEAQTMASQQGQSFTQDDVANGIAFIPERGTLLLTGKRWPVLFEVEIPELKLIQQKPNS